MKNPAYLRSIALMLALSLLISIAPVLPISATETTPLTTGNSSISPVEEHIESLVAADSNFFDYVDPQVFESGNHVLRLTEEETDSTYVFLNADGTKTVYYMDQAVKFLDADGIVQEKDLTLAIANDTYTTTKNDVNLSIPEDPTAALLSSGRIKPFVWCPKAALCIIPLQKITLYTTKTIMVKALIWYIHRPCQV